MRSNVDEAPPPRRRRRCLSGFGTVFSIVRALDGVNMAGQGEIGRGLEESRLYVPEHEHRRPRKSPSSASTRTMAPVSLQDFKACSNLTVAENIMTR